MQATIFKPDAAGKTRLDLAMLSTRYAWAAGHAAGKDVAEVACGAGAGLGWIARMARSVEAGDPDDANCYLAQETYAGREKIRIRPMDAFNLPFADASLDLVVRLHGIDDLRVAQAFLDQSRRVLRRYGAVLMATETRGLTVPEVTGTLARAGFHAHLMAGFPRTRGLSGWLPRNRSPGQVPRELEPGRHATGQLISVAPGTDLARYRTLYIEGRKTT